MKGAPAMSPQQYIKRYRMEVDLLRTPCQTPTLLPGYCWAPWTSDLLDRHAYTKWESFRGDLDSHVFPCLGEYQGCLRLMHEIHQRETFLANATWLISYEPRGDGLFRDCATIQGLAGSGDTGAIQNVGVVPAHRGRGLGRALVQQALLGFQLAGMKRVSLEVTADNVPALELYRTLGFQTVRTLYKVLEEPATVS